MWASFDTAETTINDRQTRRARPDRDIEVETYDIKLNKNRYFQSKTKARTGNKVYVGYALEDINIETLKSSFRGRHYV